MPRSFRITVYGAGSQTRSFQYVSDLVDGMIALMNSNFSQPVNLGNPEEHSILDFAQIIKSLVGGNSEVVHYPIPEDDPRRRRPDIQRAKEHLGWEPKISMREGLNRTIAFFREELKRTTLETYEKPQLGAS